MRPKNQCVKTIFKMGFFSSSFEEKVMRFAPSSFYFILHFLLLGCSYFNYPHIHKKKILFVMHYDFKSGKIYAIVDDQRLIRNCWGILAFERNTILSIFILSREVKCKGWSSARVIVFCIKFSDSCVDLRKDLVC